MNAPIVDPDLAATLRRLKLGQVLTTLPERVTLAKTNKLSHTEFLQILLSDDVTRRDASSATRRAKAAGLDASMMLDRWDPTSSVTYDRKLFDELVSLRFVEAANNVIIMGPVGVGKTFLATALGHVAVRRRHSVHFERADRLLKRLRASRLDNSHDTEICMLISLKVQEERARSTVRLLLSGGLCVVRTPTSTTIAVFAIGESSMKSRARADRR